MRFSTNLTCLSLILGVSFLAPRPADGASFKPTMYSTKVAKVEGGGSPISVLNQNGQKQTLKVTAAFRAKLKLEGSGILIDEDGKRRVLSYWKPGQYKELPAADYPSGGTARFAGGKQCPRVPFKTLAVSSGIPLGSKIFIPSTKGMKFPLPGGGTYEHDGIWYAEDRGGAITSGRVDVFLGNQWGTEIEGPLHRVFNKDRKLPYERYGSIAKCAADEIDSSLYSKLTGGGSGGGGRNFFQRITGGH
jgi:3D (Asp-Asp-Asp) domain-containing protein